MWLLLPSSQGLGLRTLHKVFPGFLSLNEVAEVTSMVRAGKELMRIEDVGFGPF